MPVIKIGLNHLNSILNTFLPKSYDNDSLSFRISILLYAIASWYTKYVKKILVQKQAFKVEYLFVILFLKRNYSICDDNWYNYKEFHSKYSKDIDIIIKIEVYI